MEVCMPGENGVPTRSHDGEPAAEGMEALRCRAQGPCMQAYMRSNPPLRCMQRARCACCHVAASAFLLR